MRYKKSPLSVLGIIIWSLAALFFLYEFFLRTFLGSVAQQIIPDLQLNAETFAILGSAYYVAYGLMQLPVGILTDRFGVKRIMIFALLLCAASAFMFAHATSFFMALVSRLLMGCGSSFAFICLLVTVATWLPKKYFAFFAGASQFIGAMGPLLAGGPLIMLLVALHESWRIVLSEIAGFGVVLAVLMLFIVRNKPKNNKKSLIVLQKAEPLNTRLLRLVKNGQAWYVAFYSASVYVSISLLGAIWGTEYLQARGLTQSIAASMVSIAWLGYAIGCPLIGAASDFLQRRKPVLIFCAVLGVFTTAGIAYLSVGNAHWVYAILFFSLGVAAAGQNVGFATIIEHVDLRVRATALGLNNGAITLFAAFVPPLVSYMIYLSVGVNMNHLKATDFSAAFTIMPALYLLSLFIAMVFIKETYCKPQRRSLHVKISPQYST